MIAVCVFYLDQLIFLTQSNCCKSCLSDICIFFNRSLLDETFLGCHQQILIIVIFLNRNDRTDLLSRH